MPDIIVESFQNTKTPPLPQLLFGGLMGLALVAMLMRYYAGIYRITWKEMGIANAPLLKILLIGAAAAVCITTILWLLQKLTWMPVPVEAAVGAVLRHYIVGSFLCRFFIICYILMFVASEELIFRSFLMPYMKKYTSRWFAIILSSALFALVHLHPQNFPFLFVYGLVFSLSFELSGAIWAPIVAHGLINIIASLM